MSARKLPPLPWPRLSEQAAYPKTPEACQCCGQAWDVDVYIECDEADRETSVAITVCEDCARVHVEPHARFYKLMEHNRPFPGAMSVCIDCPHRDGMRCGHPLLKENGGPGLSIRASKPDTMFCCGTNPSGKRTGWAQRVYSAKPWCDGRPIIRDHAIAPHLKVLAPSADCDEPSSSSQPGSRE